MTTFEAAIFDMDGLLVDSEPVWREVEVEVFGRHGVPLTEAMCLETKGMFLAEVTRYWYSRHPWRGATPDEVAAEIVEAVETRLAERADLKPGAVRALDLCEARGMRLALASSSPRRLIDGALRGVGLGGRFAVTHSAEDEPAGKPDPGIFLTTALLLGTEPARCVVFEDAPAGVVAAKAAGMYCVAVPESYGFDARLPPADGAGLELAHVVLGSLEDLDDDVLEALGARGPLGRPGRPATKRGRGASDGASPRRTRGSSSRSRPG